MYSDYENEIGNLQKFPNNHSILEKFPLETAILVTQQTVLSLKSNKCSCALNSLVTSKNSSHGLFSNRESTKDMDRERRELGTSVNNVNKSNTVCLETEDEVKWVLEVLKYSITIPIFNNIEVVKHAIHIYCNWLLKSTCDESALYGTDNEVQSYNQADFLPPCLKDYPNDYISLFLSTLCNFFKNFVVEYGNMCHSSGVPTNLLNSIDYKSDMAYTVKELQTVIELILGTIEMIAQHSTVMTEKSWNSLLYFSLYVANSLLVYPSESQHLTHQLTERISWTIFKIWLQACSKCFPRPSLWKTFSTLAQTWRHQEAFINQWNRINLSFSSRLLSLINSKFPKVPEVDPATDLLVPDDLTDDCIKDCWYRFLHLIGNPVDLCQTKLSISADLIETKRRTSQLAMTASVANLNQNFHRAMHGISTIVDAFLGLERPLSGFALVNTSINFNVSGNTQNVHRTTAALEQSSPETRRNPNPFINIKLVGKQKQVGQPPQRLSQLGDAVTGSSNHPFVSTGGPTELSIDGVPEPHPERPSVNSMLRLFGTWLFEAAIVGVKQNLDNTAISSRANKIEPSRFNQGRAEACGSLCRIFTHSQRRELSMEYLTKFYIILYYGLDIEHSTASSLVLSSILFNTTEILRISLTGVHILVPRIFRAVQFVLLNDMERPDLITKNQLRRAAINHLLSLVSLPTYFISIDIKSLLPVTTLDKKESYFEIRKSMISLLSENIRYEPDQKNLHMLIGCLSAYLENLTKDDQDNDQNRKNKESSPTEKCEIRFHNVSILLPSAMTNNGSETFNHALGLLSINLVHKWKDDMLTLQSVIEALSDMAKIKFRNIDRKICMRSIRFLCEFIENQMNRKSKEHSRLLHNIIISAYYCLSMWLVHHTYLLDDKDCLSAVMEIAELGISGSKSKMTSNGVGQEMAGVCMKADKVASPTSKRVQIAAEYLVHCIMCEVHAFPSLAGPGTTGSLVTESTLLASLGDCTSPTSSDYHTNFRYFGLDNDVVMALLERPLASCGGSSLDPLPTVFVILRTAFGRYAWQMRSRQLPIEADCGPTAASSSGGSIDIGDSPLQASADGGETNLQGQLFCSRPFNTGIFRQHMDFRPPRLDDNTSQYGPDVDPTFFPDMVYRTHSFQVDFSIPRLESLLDDSEKRRIEAALVDNLKSVNHLRAAHIKQRRNRIELLEYKCKKPTPVSEIQTARLLLYQFGYLSINSFLVGGSCIDGTLSSNHMGSLPPTSYANRRRASDTTTATTAGAGAITSSSGPPPSSPAFAHDVGTTGTTVSNLGGAASSMASVTISTATIMPATTTASQSALLAGNNSGNMVAATGGSANAMAVPSSAVSNTGASTMGACIVTPVAVKTQQPLHLDMGSTDPRSDTSIYPLDSSTANFFTTLDSLDHTPSRSTDTCLVYYVRPGHWRTNEILGSFNDWPNFNTDFLALLLTLGWQVDVASHPGWTGNQATSYLVPAAVGSSSEATTPIYKQRYFPVSSGSGTNSVGSGGSQLPRELSRLLQGTIPDGNSSLIYWADSLKEVAFLLVSCDSLAQALPKADQPHQHSASESSATAAAVTPSGSTRGPNLSSSMNNATWPEKMREQHGLAVVLLWVEQWDDIELIRVPELLGPDRCAIIVCPTPEGLFRIRLHRPPAKYYLAGPLHSGMLLELRSLGTLVRQTVVNINRRIRQDSEHLYAAHLQRSSRLQHVITEHRLCQTTQQQLHQPAASSSLVPGHSQCRLPDLFTSLLHPAINRTEPRF